MLSAAYEQPEQYPDCARVEPRTNMFVMAALVTGHTRETVKVRNMSASGALVEGPTLPNPGTPCLLNRGEIALEEVLSNPVFFSLFKRRLAQC